MKKRVISRKSKHAQVWVETVIYTLIGLTVIGLLLAVSMPAINAQRDRALIDQSINALNKIDERVYDTLSGTGNKRRLELNIGKGEVLISPESDSITWTIDSRYQYSEENLNISAGKVNIRTTAASPWEVTLSLSFPFDIRYNNDTQLKQFSQSSLPHVITVENLGVENNRTVISFNEV